MYITTFLLVFLSVVPIFDILTQSQSDILTTSDCGETKGCLRFPRGCTQPTTCNSFVTWMYNETENTVTFELSGQTDGWVAIALSNDGFMGDDSVMHCVRNNSDASSPIIVGLSFNYPYNINSDIQQSSVIVHAISRSYINGRVYCKFSRTVAGDLAQNVYSLNSEYYLLLGYGPAINGVKQRHQVNPHVQAALIDVTKSRNNYNAETASVTLPPSNTTNTVGRFTDGASNEVTYSRSPDDDQTVLISMTRKLGAAISGYLSFGLSNDKIMDDDNVLDCIRLPKGIVIVQSSFNGRHVNHVLSPAHAGIVEANASFVDGVLKCDVKRSIRDAASSNQIFPLDKAYYLMMAYGSVNDQGEKQQHQDRIVSDNAVVLSEGGVVGETTGGGGGFHTRMLRAHGILMITAWVLLISTSIIIARYYKTAWPNRKLCNKPIWFLLHLFLNLLAVSCTISGFIMIFYVNSGKLSSFPSTMPSYFWVHAPLGITVMCLALINPIMAIFRCDPASEKRPIFNWLHWMVGEACLVIAIINVFFGAKIGEIHTKICHIAIFWILIAFVGFHVLVESLLCIDKCITEARSKRSFQVQYEMSKPGEVPRVVEPAGSAVSLIFRYLTLLLYFIVVLGLWLAMIILIGMGKIN